MGGELLGEVEVVVVDEGRGVREREWEDEMQEGLWRVVEGGTVVLMGDRGEVMGGVEEVVVM
uniref:hypothetical protein n=1 Tax=Corynebacterium glyciniphilum TaxID=1404244 RepID=UPI0016429355